MAGQPKGWVPTVLLFGIVGLLIGGVFQYRASTYDADTVKCGDEVMTQGDTCVGYGDDERTGSYDDVKEEQDSDNAVNAVLGPLVLAFGGVCLVVGLVGWVQRRRLMARMR